MRSDSWSSERVALLRRLWADGETAAAIAARLGGISRSAVMGKVFRLRLHAADAPPLPPTKQTVAQRTIQAAAPMRRRRSSKRTKRSQPAPIINNQRKTLLELTNKTCRWPHGRAATGKFFFCGAPEADLERGIPYCARHMRRAYPAWAAIAESPPTAPGSAASASD